ncbi:hypothetical protein M9H77_22737 [Catharanthus roseus]|uniref:Uncharacterized protein n=1 Tax=Catharanthus roseus TaxID=4058 RepID=A0ACC0ARB3_CATRO|nr:hypothetical protein M9H77_22737 [Catharanthus roseus]
MVKLIDKPILAMKKISEESLEQYKVMELVQGMGCVELALFTEQYNENLVKEFYANSLKSLVILRVQPMASKITLPCPFLIIEYLLDCGDLSIPSDSWVKALDPLLMPKSTAPSVVPPSPTLSTQGHIGPDRSISTKVTSPSPPLPSPDSSVVTTSLDLLNQQLSICINLSNTSHRLIMWWHKSYSVAAAPCVGIVLGKLINPEKSGTVSCDMVVRLREVESIKKGQNLKKKKKNLQGINE